MSQTRLTVTRQITTDGVHLIALAGDIDHTTAEAFRQALTTDGSYPRHTVLDFRDVTFMDSTGVNVLIAANNTARARNGWLRLARTPTLVLDVLHIVGLDDYIGLYPTLNDALAA
ncbi:STAS domain-containing protein [Streptomyces sp. NPDC058305]|uniref:STAS domain-containing protein n=1 Tax=Streptomyces sp. NPDC058305 TaxID=3346438 RepID=UPI0036E14F2C